MSDNQIRKIVYILVAIVCAIVVVNIFIWLLPVILVLIVAYYIYNLIRGCRYGSDIDNKKNKKGKSNKISKRIVIIDEEDSDS